MMNTMIKKSPNLVTPSPRRNDEIRDEEVDNDDGIIYPPGYSVATASPIPMNDPNSLPLAPAVLIVEHNTHSAEEGRLPSQNGEESSSRKTDSRFDPFRPIHPQCNHISYGCLTMVFLVFVGIAVLLKTYLPDILPPSNNDESVIPYPSTARPTVTRSNPPSMYLSHTPSITRYEEKKLFVSDGSSSDRFGWSCSKSEEIFVIGATGVDNFSGAAYLFHLDGTEVKELTPNDGDENNYFGYSVSIDEKIVVGTWKGTYVRVFSRGGIYERTITCDDCPYFGDDVATHGNLIAVDGKQNDIWKLFIYSTDGQLLKALDQGTDSSEGVAISRQFIVSTGRGGTTIYSNISPDFTEIAEINQGGWEVAVSNKRLVIADYSVNGYDGAAYLYKTDGTLVKTLDRQDASSGSLFGRSVAITDDKVLVGAPLDDDQGEGSGSVFIYSAVTGEFIEKITAPDAEAHDHFGSCVSASDSHYIIVGTYGVDNFTGAAYLFQLP